MSSLSIPGDRVSSKPHHLSLVHRPATPLHWNEVFRRLSKIIFGNFQLGCTLIIPGLKAQGGCKEHFQRAGFGGGEIEGGEERDGKKRFLWQDSHWEPNSSIGGSLFDVYLIVDIYLNWDWWIHGVGCFSWEIVQPFPPLSPSRNQEEGRVWDEWMRLNAVVKSAKIQILLLSKSWPFLGIHLGKWPE